MSEKRITFRLAAYTDPAGKWSETAPKKGNEDDLFVDSDLSSDVQGSFIADRETVLSDAGCLMVVADGMGGMNAGEVASAIAIETVRAAFEGKNLTSEVLASSASRVRYMEDIVVRADAAVKKRSKEDRSCEGMGSTLIMAWLYDNQLSVTWCGDSRAYLFRETAGIKQISKDHSYVQSLVDKGDITEVEAFDHPYGNIITRNLGDPEKKAVPDSVTLPVYKGDVILVCSDGLSGVLRDRKSYDREGNLIPGDNLEDIIRCNRRTMTSCREALWAAAEAADWYDNVTAVLCEITEGEEAPEIPAVESGQSAGVNRSFISIKLRKRTLRTVLIVLAALIVCLAALMVFLKVRPGNAPAPNRFLQVRDSLMREAVSADMRYVQEWVRSTPDSAEMTVLAVIGEDLRRRLDIKDVLDTLWSHAMEEGRSEVAQKIAVAMDSVKKAVSFKVDIEALRAEVFSDRRTSAEQAQKVFRQPDKAGRESAVTEDETENAGVKDSARLTVVEDTAGLTEVKDKTEDGAESD